jgi:hypothetical protein
MNRSCACQAECLLETLGERFALSTKPGGNGYSTTAVPSGVKQACWRALASAQPVKPIVSICLRYWEEQLCIIDNALGQGTPQAPSLQLKPFGIDLPDANDQGRLLVHCVQSWPWGARMLSTTAHCSCMPCQSRWTH